MKENGIGFVFRIIGTFYVCYILTKIMYSIPGGFGGDGLKAVVGILLGCLFVFFMWLGTLEER